MTDRDVNKNGSRLLRGAFINTGKANCSIFESGRMVYECISHSENYVLDYFSLDMFDTAYFARTGAIRGPFCDGAANSGPGDYDFWVFNWHFYTMGSILPVKVLRVLRGIKLSIILELDPDNPLVFMPHGVFHGYIALDPNVERGNGIFPFPRPLNGQPRKPPKTSNGAPTIGSFGFATPGKGFELLVEAVNREFDQATIRINIPTGAYTQDYDRYHRAGSSEHIESVCRRIAKPGIDLVFTYDFMSPEALIDWCAANDLNCFMYTRQQPGLSATTDQAIISGRPLLALANDTFRHIHRYISPYPEVTLREALNSHADGVARIQQDWSRQNFQRTFNEMLASFGLLQNVDVAPWDAGNPRRRAVVLHAHFDRSYRDDILSYTKRLSDSLRRIGDWFVITAQPSTVEHLRKQVERLRPDIVVLSEADELNPIAIADALADVAGPKVVVSDAADRWLGSPFSVQPRRPIVPFFTVKLAPLCDDPPAIWLIGFGDPASELEQAANKIATELQAANIFVGLPPQKDAGLNARIKALQASLSDNPAVRIVPQRLPATGRQLADMLCAASLIVIHTDPRHPREMEAIASLSMVTERAVVFTRASNASNGRIFEDLPVSELIDLGLAAQIRLIAELGEWTMGKNIRALCQGWQDIVRDARAEIPAKMAGRAGQGFLSVRSLARRMQLRRRLSLVSRIFPLKRLRNTGLSLQTLHDKRKAQRSSKT